MRPFESPPAARSARDSNSTGSASGRSSRALSATPVVFRLERREDPLSRIVRDARDKVRLRQRELAARASVDRALIARLEAGREARLSTLSRIAESVHARLCLAFEFDRDVESIVDEQVVIRHRAIMRIDPGTRRGMRRRQWRAARAAVLRRERRRARDSKST